MRRTGVGSDPGGQEDAVSLIAACPSFDVMASVVAATPIARRRCRGQRKHRHRRAVEMASTKASCSAFGHLKNEIQSLIFRGNSTLVAASVQVTLIGLAVSRGRCGAGMAGGSDIQCRFAGVSCDNECHFLPLRVPRNVRNASIGFTDFISSNHRSEWHAACGIIYLHICDK